MASFLTVNIQQGELEQEGDFSLARFGFQASWSEFGGAT